MSAWEGTSGRVTDYDGEVEQAYFAFGTGNSVDRMFLYLKSRPIDGTEVDTDDGLVEERFSIGSGWATYDGGETVEKTQGTKKFHVNTAYFGLIGRVVNLIGGMDNIGKVFGDKDPTDASIWIGCQFHWEEEDASFTGSDGKRVENTRNMPTKFLGKKESGQAASSGSPGSGSPGSANGLNEMKRLAKSSASYSDWIDACMALPEIASNDMLVQRLSEQATYDQFRSE